MAVDPALTCPACGGARLQPQRLRLERTTLARCPRCGHAISVGRRSPVTADDYVTEGGERAAYETHYLPARRRSWARGLDLVGPANGRSLLDVGCNYGHFLEFAAARGWRVTGFEPGPRLRRAALPSVASRIAGSLEEAAGTAGGRVAVATLWDVLEHVDEPRQLLAQLASMIEPTGAMLVRVPDARALAAFSHGARRPLAGVYLTLCHPTNPEEHAHHFTPASLALFGQSAGLRAAATITSGADERIAAGRTPVDAAVRKALHRLGRDLPYEFTTRLVPVGAA